MSAAPTKKVRQMPKGGRKGGASFPRVSLSDSLVYARKLVAKTHAGPQAQDVIFAGVVGAKSGKGQVRIAALKQYGLLKGDAKTGYLAADLAKRIEGAPQDELQPLLRTAALNPLVFKKIFDAYHGDIVTRAKIRQRVIDLNVHPEEAENCVGLYVSNCVVAELASADGDKIAHVSLREMTQESVSSESAIGAELGEVDEQQDSSLGDANPSDSVSASVRSEEGTKNKDSISAGEKSDQVTPRAVFNVNVTLDSSLDIEKLQKQLELLKRFGAI